VRNIAAAFPGSGTGASDYEGFLTQQSTMIELIAVGVTEAGLAEKSPAMVLLARSLETLLQSRPQQRLSVIDLDNVSGNGDKIKQLMYSHFAATPAILAQLASSVTFHNSVVDRITAARPDNSLIPRGEPIPHKVPPCIFTTARKHHMRSPCFSEKVSPTALAAGLGARRLGLRLAAVAAASSSRHHPAR
jgi:hypothetical protein